MKPIHLTKINHSRQNAPKCEKCNRPMFWDRIYHNWFCAWCELAEHRQKLASHKS